MCVLLKRRESVLSDVRIIRTVLIFMKHGLYIGFNGIATFANLSCYKVFTPDFLSYCVLETDAPFLTPEPKRGKINEPGNIKYIAAYLANQLGVSPTQVAKKTTQNVRNLFNLPYPD